MGLLLASFSWKRRKKWIWNSIHYNRGKYWVITTSMKMDASILKIFPLARNMQAAIWRSKPKMTKVWAYLRFSMILKSWKGSGNKKMVLALTRLGSLWKSLCGRIEIWMQSSRTQESWKTKTIRRVGSSFWRPIDLWNKSCWITKHFDLFIMVFVWILETHQNMYWYLINIRGYCLRSLFILFLDINHPCFIKGTPLCSPSKSIFNFSSRNRDYLFNS